ncbi:hypothetical protein C5167_040672 [Papaver somniferum]|uniref:CCR4-NOT transcription complex subunit 1 TTP binding domain-containing protein n=1 Tax=Papaver somniferum TaxID=3469 RepID=A0A4Y7IFH5_PAPSO|nr:hypothetical protein C5167_040672 [Papaver somniferum]
MENPDTRIQNNNDQLQLSDGASEFYSKDVEAEANSYFHKLFSGKLTTIELVHVLFRFKESPEVKNHSIYSCMIGNLFEEYKFLPKYPYKELSVVAVLLGSLIKHHLLSHLLLGVALRGVLDALHNLADTKMYLFGTKALEQYVDRLVEWPNYSRHIMQVPHLRATHPKLVVLVECALARSSSTSHSEASIDDVAPTDHHHGTSQVGNVGVVNNGI